jgi:hypothetical protein
MANTYIQIGSTVTVGSGGAANITFSSIPATFTDLLVLLSIRTTRAGNPDQLDIKFNGSSSNYTQKTLEGFNNATSSYSNTKIFCYVNGGTSTANTFGNGSLYIPNYAGSTNKAVSIESATENNSAGGGEFPAAGYWSDVSAITSIAFTSTTADNIAEFSTATLYGIKKN